MNSKYAGESAPADLKYFSQLNEHWIKSASFEGSDAGMTEMEGFGSAGIKSDRTYIYQDIGWVKRYSYADGGLIHWGWALRIVIEIESLEIDANIDVCGFVLTADTQGVNAQMYVTLLGIVSANIPSRILQPTAESYTGVLADFGPLIMSANDDNPETKLDPTKIFVHKAPGKTDKYTASAYKLYAMSMLSGHHGPGEKIQPYTMNAAIKRMINHRDQSLADERLFVKTVKDVYSDFGITNADQPPSDAQQEHAFEIANELFTRRGQ